MSGLAATKGYYDVYDWRYTGEHWASRWGGTDVQWFGTILPRIQSFLPASTILELGPGYGRLSRYLREHCDRLVLADMTEPCVEACSERFLGDENVSCVHTNGLDIRAVEDGSLDFVFSFFSLVHADVPTMTSYVNELARTLRRDGVAFLHHSNLADCGNITPENRNDLADYRDATVGADAVRQITEEAGLLCRSQELFSWEMGELLTDCFTVIARPKSRWAMLPARISNRNFHEEITRLRELAEIYGALGYAF